MPPPPPDRASLGAQARRGRGWRRSPAFRIFLVVFIAALVFSGVLFVRCGLRGCPNVDRLTAYQPGRAPVLLDRNGKPFEDLAPMQGEMVRLSALPEHVPAAFLAVEDQRFYAHHGVDWRRVGGAVLANLRAGGYDEGFSTLSMQLARNVFPDRIRARDRTPLRKLLEIRVALAIEAEYEKDEILELYLNHIYFGNGARGIGAASRHYFGIPAERLSLAQAATLAAMPKGPSLYDPRRHAKAARERRDLVLSLMEEQKRITPKQADAAREQPLRVVRRRAAAGRPAPFAAWFVEEVRRDLEERFGEALYEDTLKIHTTLDVAAQKAAEEELRRQLSAIEQGALGRYNAPRYGADAELDESGTPYLQGAVVMLDSRTGDVLAWVGGRDFRHSRFDRVRAGRRQAGSAFKPFVYAAALASGRTLSQHLVDEPIRVPLDRRRYWEPRNFDGHFDGPVSMREALVRSKNIPTIRLAESVGYQAVAQTAEKMGVEGPIATRPAMPLGTVSVSPLELTTAYTVFATLGEAARPRLIKKVEHPDGEVLFQAEAEAPSQILEPGVAFLVTDALREALERGTGTAVREAGFRGPAAGKTGTTNDGTDTWFVGYTPEVVATVWIGFDQPRPITTVATGGRVAAPVWARLMSRYYAGRAMPAPWRPPSGVYQATVDAATGLILAEGCQPQDGIAYREYFVRGMSPPSVCPSHGVPPEILAEYALPLPDDEEALELATELPEELREPRRVADAAEEEEAAESEEPPAAEELVGPPAPSARPGAEASPRARPAGEASPRARPGLAPSPRAGATAAPSPRASAVPTRRPTPQPVPDVEEPVEPAPRPAATPSPTPPPSDPPSDPPS